LEIQHPLSGIYIEKKVIRQHDMAEKNYSDESTSEAGENL